MRKIIFLDVDGTLVTYENRIPASAVSAIREARKQGHRVYICTGRSRAEVSEELWDIGFDGMIGGNGSYVEDHGKVVMHQRITPEQCRHIVDWLHARKLEFYLECNSGLYASEHFETEAVPAVHAYMKGKGQDSADLQVRDVFEGIRFGENLYRDDVNKVSYILSSYQDYLDSIEEFPDLKPGTWGGKGETALFGDLGVKGIDKAYSIERLLEHIGADREDTIAFGDAKVDIPMLSYCQTGVAMGNGGEEIRAMADFVTDDVEKDGLYEAFQKLRLLGENGKPD